jgi:hypothetical protein
MKTKQNALRWPVASNFEILPRQETQRCFWGAPSPIEWQVFKTSDATESQAQAHHREIHNAPMRLDARAGPRLS